MVPGVGPQPCLGMIVGEAPGFEEEKQGRPFVGRSGILLTTALKALGIDLSGVYVTNVVKEIPLTEEQKIRAPSEEEILGWLAILHGEIESTSPAAILALGRTATQTLTDIEGEKVPFGSKVGNVYTAWHPAYVLRNRRSHQDWLLEQLKPWAEAIHAAAFGA